jgi:hypothetical protein
MTAREKVEEAYDKILELSPTCEEIQEFADEYEETYGVVTYSKSKGGSNYFIRFHDKTHTIFGGDIHIDVGFVDTKINDWRTPDTTHLMLDQFYAPLFIEFIFQKRKK